jgi:hypothetical protein
LIPDEAVEAVAMVLIEDGAYGVPWGDASGDDRADAMGKARILLKAAAPIMLAYAEQSGWQMGYSKGYQKAWQEAKALG